MKRSICILSAIFMLASCARIPKEILSPKMKIDNTGSVSRVIVEFSVYNDNHSVVLKDYSGKMTLKTINGKEIFSKNFKIDKILPFSSATASVEAELDSENLAVLAESSQIEKTELEKKSVIEDVFVVEDMILLNDISAKKTDINDVLEGK